MNVFQSLDIFKNEDFGRVVLYEKERSSNNKYLNIFLSKFPRQTMSRPLMIHIETVNVCNHSCIFCAQNLNKDEKKVMSLELFSKILSDYEDIGGGLISLTPSPGEVFLDPLLKERLQLVEKFPKVAGLSITTNGIGSEKISDDDLRYMLSRFKWVHISIYGLDASEYQLITGRKTFDRCISAIQRIVEFSKPGTICFGFRLLYDRTPNEISEWIQNSVGQTIPFGYTLEYSTWGSLIGTKLNQLPGDARWVKMPRITTPCFRPVISMKVCVNGDVSLCCCGDSSARDLILGSVKDNSIEELYNSKKCMKFWNSGECVPETCKSCTTYQPFKNFNSIWLKNPIDYIGG